MKKGLLITNAFLASEKFRELYELLTKAAENNDTEGNKSYPSIYQNPGEEMAPAPGKDIDVIDFDDPIFGYCDNVTSKANNLYNASLFAFITFHQYSVMEVSDTSCELKSSKTDIASKL